jgi:hypothetical protein
MLKLLKPWVVGLVSGLISTSALAHTATITTTGPNSTNRVTISESHRVDISNNNDVDVDTDVDQVAVSGDATVSRNTEGGDASTGDAVNDSDIDTSVAIANSSGCGGCGTGAGSPTADSHNHSALNC